MCVWVYIDMWRFNDKEKYTEIGKGELYQQFNKDSGLI